MRSKPHSRGTLKLLKLRFFHVAGVNDRIRRHCSCRQVKLPSWQSSKTCLFVPPIYHVGQFKDPKKTSVVLKHFLNLQQFPKQNLNDRKISTLSNLQKLKIGHGRSHRPGKPEMSKKEWRHGYVYVFWKCPLWILPRKKPFENRVLLFEGGSSEKNIHVRKVILKKWVERFLDLEKVGW